MKLHHLRDLLAVVEKGSIRAAAKHLGLGQPALSRSLRDLEQELGVPLLERRARGAVLTELGEMFARRAGAAFNELSRAREEIAQHQGDVHGKINICLSSLSHLVLLPHALPSFTRRYPRVVMSVVEGAYPMVERRLVDGTMDFFVGPLSSNTIAPGLRQEKLFDNQRIVLARRGHPLQDATSLADLIDSDWVTTSITNDPHTEFNELFIGIGLPPPRLAFRAESLLTMVTAMTCTDMLSISPSQYASAPLLSGLLRQVPIRELLPGPTLFLIQRAAIPLTPAAEHLADLLRRAALREARRT